MTNYDKYFSDIGTIRSVKDAFLFMECGDCRLCPFHNWGELFNVGLQTGCAAFISWLEMEVG